MKSSATGKTVRHVLDPDEPLSPELAAELEALTDRPIDFSDIPPQHPDESWITASPLATLRNKQQITLRIDSDVLEFFKNSGQRYQTRINSVLREYMKAHVKS
ncbi:BrnA antitoxin family protein [Luteibacter sp. RCC_6_2]|jgi:uncharacterized protein (DUF4415 family)|uniref:BrnA antitoxin family protein n=1 Tax=Luteibacter sp. RCC_6_2 TaxID=3239223 RepID=UPI003525DF48